MIIKFQGGLGNQMFQYALYRKLQYLGKEVYADIYTYLDGKEKKEFELYKFGINLRLAEKRYCERLSGISSNYIKKIRYMLFPVHTYLKETDLYYKKDIFDKLNLYLNGYWQSEKYFFDIREVLIDEFKFPSMESELGEKYKNEILFTNSVSIHIRLGDYLDHPDIYGGICTRDYYYRAIEYIKKQIVNAHFYVFSNDIIAAKDMFQGTEFTFIECENIRQQGLRDLELMSLCKHNIIANSSYSWWGAWLNENREKCVIAPRKWLNDIKVEDIWCQGWTVI
ncbi:Glycosyl transferase family 11 [Lachnospiraceae bacterium NLAE-zl-G231]|nr:Glycosyl transferase family 11 [Lachnospiraceae bacterium NLAE-zl-G231]